MCGYIIAYDHDSIFSQDACLLQGQEGPTLEVNQGCIVKGVVVCQILASEPWLWKLEGLK